MNYQKIKLLGGAEVHVDFDAKRVACKKCKKLIRFALTKNGKQMPIIEKGSDWQAHFADCEFAAEFRKSDGESRVAEAEKNQEALNNL
jgi:hypothetical protein